MNKSNMDAYIQTIYNVYLKTDKMANLNVSNKKLKCISIIIYNYLNKLSIDNNIIINTLTITNDINMIPFFKYIDVNNIELLDFNTLQETDINVSNAKDIERFVLTHVYYLTQNNNSIKTI
jgi:hypothetical protein